ncbi:DEAD/DEAH box helicase [Hymenobacter latericus]|uniref:DEAD/DEAH box helicase n=1 Tax=Hymenobacter sp. YIM 151858-1 TaxID=2987688 RepID=UPI0022269FA1|nr:AAA domain-containing protein [Hymenobacter sp. YIM 151858-1]UYZ60206.1 AAA domain-containing protein [Hymenobacter sp. YIM 151858-1]
MYLRTNCDRELFFSLFKSNSHAILEAAGIPVPLSARPNIQLVTAAGVEFEDHEYNMLVNMFGTPTVQAKKKADGKFDEIDLVRALRAVPTPGLCLQPAIEPEDFRSRLLEQNLGLTPTQVLHFPALQGMRPDIVLVRPNTGLLWEVMPTGKRRRLPATEPRLALSVVDVKNTAEGNKSYAAEVVLYSIVLANWLEENGLQNDYFVSDECFLWTHQEKPALDALLASHAGVTTEQKFQVILDTLEKVEFSVVAPSVVRFLKQDVLRVLDQAAAHGWTTIDYHVCGLCSNCDWLGYERWLTGDDKTKLQAHPDWYCKPAALSSDHLSQLPQLSKGARQVLEADGTCDLSGLCAIDADEPVLREHSFLKRVRRFVARRAQAIKTGVTDTDADAVLAGLARWIDLQIFIVVNFDAAAGCLTGIAFRYVHFVQQPNGEWLVTHDQFESTVENNNRPSEWHTLHSFLDKFQKVFKDVKQVRENNGKTGEDIKPKTQIHFWEPRQFEELCAAVGRHLPIILGQPGRSLLPAIARLFPPDELLPRDSAISPYIVFVGELAQRVVFGPEAHAFTLWATYEAYHKPGYDMRMDNYFQDPFGNGIPRERIYEVWKNQGTIRSGNELKTKSKASADYASALAKQVRALSEITDRLRTEFRPRLQGDAIRLSLTNPTGPRGVAFDSKVWMQWAEISAKTARLEREAEFVLPAEALEASYKALVLMDQIAQHSPTEFRYRVSPDSRETKLDDNGEYFVLGNAQRPGLPLETPYSLGLPLPPADDPARRFYFLSIAQLIRVRLRLNRETLEAGIELLPRNPNSAEQATILGELLAQRKLPVDGQLFLMDGLPYSQEDEICEILRAVGNPACAVPDPAASVTLGTTPSRSTGTPSALTPLAEVLWQANALVTTNPPRSAAQAAALAARATHYSGLRNASYALDPSQQQAIEAVAQQRLSLVWGPPGTGKTSTLVAYLLAVIEEANRSHRPRNILLTGPNYRAVEVLAHKLLKELNQLPALPADLFVVYSRSRPVAPLPEPGAAHLTAAAVRLTDPATDPELRLSFFGPDVSIFATSAHNARKLAHVLTNGNDSLPEAFDLLILDESSQVPLELAFMPLATLKPAAEVLIAGDPKQMPPIHALDPPAGAEHLVGSIHNYLLDRFNLAQQPLLVNYRSCEAIVDYARTLGYPHDLRASQSDLCLELRQPISAITLPASLSASTDLRPALEAVLAPDRAVTALLYHDTRSSQANRSEAQQAAALAYLLRHAAAAQLAPQAAGFTFTEFTDEDFFKYGIGVVTPHKAQRALVLAQLRQLFPGVAYEVLQGAVDTVERFQGGERHTIIVSYGVGDVDVIQGEEEFLMQMERTNVAVSRAMAKCILLMPYTLAYHLPADSKVSQSAGALKSYLEEFCANRQVFTLPAGGEVEIRWK